MRELVQNDQRFSTISGNTFIDFEHALWPFNLSCSSEDQSGIEFQSKGHWKPRLDSLTANLDSLTGHLGKHSFKLEEPATITLKPDFIGISPLSMTLDRGSLQLALDYAKDNMHFTMSLRAIPLELLNSGIPATGLGDADVDLLGSPSDLTGNMKIQLKEVKILEESFSKFAPMQAKIAAKLKPSCLEGSAKLFGLGDTPLELELKFPVSLSFHPFAVKIDKEKEMHTRLTAQGNIAPVLQLMALDKTNLSAQMKLDLQLVGSFQHPEIQGQVEISNGSFESLDLGAIYHNVSAHLVGEGKHLALRDFRAEDEKGGFISGTGLIELNPEKHLPFTFAFDLNKTRILRLDFARATASGKINLEGNLHEPLLKGKIRTDSIHLTIPEETSAITPNVEVTYVNIPEDEAPRVYYPKPNPSLPLNLDLDLEIPNKLSIKDKNLSSEWKGNLKVTGTNHTPLANGDLRIMKGEYHFNGKTFEIKQGTISFAGDLEKKINLYVIASKDLGKITAEIILKGPLKNPGITFRSSPPLSQREILSWLLFGRGISEITPFQGAQLNQSIVDLKSDNQGPDMLTAIRNRIGLDLIDINRGEDGESDEVSLKLGKYISNGIFLTLDKSIGAEANRIGIEATVLPNIKVQGQVGDDAQGQVLLKWKHDY